MSSLAAVLLVAPVVAGAQGSVATGEENFGVLTCGSYAYVPQSQSTLSCSPSVLNGTALTSASASSVNGVLKASTAMDFAFNATSPTAARGSEVSAFSAARWDDQATVTPVAGSPAATRLNITFGVDGATSSMGPDFYGSGHNFSAIGGYSAVGSFLARSANPFADPDAAVSITSGSGYTRNQPDAFVNSNYVFSLFLDASGNSNAFSYTVYTSVLAFRYPYDPAPLAGTVISDFSHTVIPLFYQVLDANDNDVTGNYNVSFANGMTFAAAAPVTTTPEPGSLALLGTGLVSLVPMVRRRRRK